jgi:peptidoglycan/xylan/chitin deacetylase (PgdA/CDA1 family)
MIPKRSFKDYFLIMVNFTMIFVLLINPIQRFFNKQHDELFIYIPYESESQSLNELQLSWFNEFKATQKQIYGLATQDYSFVYLVSAHPIQQQWVELIIQTRVTHKETFVQQQTYKKVVIHRMQNIEYPVHQLKEENQALILAQALHQHLHSKENELIVNVIKLKRFIQQDTTTLSLGANGLSISSNECQEFWCPNGNFNETIDLGFIHDTNLVPEHQWKDPLHTGIFKSDSHIDESLPMMALTFDDGPKKISLNLLNILEQSKTKATFFWIGLEVKNNPNIAKQFVEHGHEIGNHTYHHPDLSKMTLSEVLKEIEMCDDIIESTVGFKPTIMRPPYGLINHEDLSHFDHTVIRWNLDTVDWRYLGVEEVLTPLMTSKDGDIILMHDVFDKTHMAVEPFIQHQLSLGIQFVKVSEIIEHRQLHTKTVYGVRKPTDSNH